VLEQLIDVINHPFDFRKKVSVNMELMKLNTARMATYGIIIGIPQLTITLLANIKTTTKSDYGRDFCSAMHARKKYAYNHVHDVTLLQTILTELAGANGVRTLHDAPAPNAGTAHSVANLVSFLNSMMLNSDINLNIPDQLMVLAPTVAHLRSSASLANTSTRNKKKQRLARKRKKKRTRMKSQRRTCTPIARNTTARSPVVSSQTNARGTKI